MLCYYKQSKQDILGPLPYIQQKLVFNCESVVDNKKFQ